jgi:F0F1-type ATP synthase membrane subunit b/b'
MFRTKPTRTEKLKAQVVEVRDQAAPTATAAAERLKEAYEEARVRAAPVAADLADRARPRIEAAESTLVDSVLPKMGAALGVASAAVAQGAHEAKDLMRDY